MTPRKAVVVLIAALALSCVQCGGRRFGETPLAPRAPGAASSGALTLPRGFPTSEGFNLARAQRFSAGDAKAESETTSKGTATSSVTVTGVGSGWAEFEVGQVIPAGRSGPINIVAAITLAYRYKVERRATDGIGGDGQLTLKAIVMDSKRRVVRRHVFTDTSLKESADDGTTRAQPEFALALEPDLAYQIIIAGRIEVAESDRARDLSASLAMDELRVDLRPGT